jgi:outer membrane protein TolC
MLSFVELDQLPAAEDAAAARHQALLIRTDVLGALADYEASQAALQLEVSKQYPDIHIGPGYALDQGHEKFTLGASLSLPLFDRNQGPIAEAEANRRKAAAAFQAQEARAVGEIELAIAAYGEARRKLATADALVERQRQRLKSMHESFAAGAVGRVDLLQIQLELAAVERARATAFTGAQFARGALEDALQREIGSGETQVVPKSLLNAKSQ